MRRFATIAVVAVSALLAGCRYEWIPDPSVSGRDAEWLKESRNVELWKEYERYRIDYSTTEKPGTIIVDSKRRFLYLVEDGGKAIRYGVAVGDEAFGWTGEATVRRKAEWPDWTPPAEMRKRWPHVPTHMAGGPQNPLGSRALYLHDKHGRDTLYRIHGTNDPLDIGQAVSSGCIRMRNVDAVDLFNRVPLGTKVIVM